METKKYTISELKRIINEASNEFKPVLGKDVEKDNKKINDASYSDSAKKTKAYDGGSRKEKKNILHPTTDNKGMQDLEYDNISDDFKDRVKSQMKGYTSAEAEKMHKNDPFGNAEFNEIKGMDDNHERFQDGKKTAKQIGLTSKHIDKKEFDKLTGNVLENKNIVKLKFKNTVFLSEGHMKTRIPDNYKVDGNKFIMKDKENNEYLVEWNEGSEPKITNFNKINEQENIIMELFNYKRIDSNTTCKTRMNENNAVNDMINKARQLMK